MAASAVEVAAPTATASADAPSTSAAPATSQSTIDATAHSPADAISNGSGDMSGGASDSSEPSAKRRKRKSLWDQPAPTTGPPASLPSPATPLAATLPVPSNPLLAALQAQFALLPPHLSPLGTPHLAASHALSSPTTASRLDRRVYVGSLAYDVTEDTLRIIFEPFGAVVKVDMPKEPGHVPVRSKGFAFVEFEQPESARAALQFMNGMPLKGRPMKVNTPTGGTNAQTSLLSQLLQQQGGQGLAQLQGQQLNAAAMAAIQAAQIASGGTLTGLPGSLSTAVPGTASAAPAFTLPAHLTSSLGGVSDQLFGTMGSGGQQQQKTRIYVGSLVWQLTEEQVRAIFEPFGAIRSCQLIINPETGKHRGYGFIEFADEKSAADAIQEMDNFNLVGRQLKVRYASALNAPQAAQQAYQHSQLQLQQQLGGGTPQLPPGFNVPQLPASLLPSAPSSQAPLSLSTEDGMRISSAEQRVSVMNKLSALSRQSPVLLLRNLLAPAEVDAELEGEVRDECGKFGAVREVRVVVADDEVRCYVLFDSAAECSRAVEALNGRWFGKRTVQADFYPLERFQQGVFTAS